MRAILCLVLLALTACEPTRVERVKPPADLTSCAAEPAAPALPPIPWASVETARPVVAERDRQVLAYILALVEAGADCRAKVAGVKAWGE